MRRETIEILRRYVSRLETEYYELMDSKGMFEIRADGMREFKQQKRRLADEITKARNLIVFHSKKLKDESEGVE